MDTTPRRATAWDDEPEFGRHALGYADESDTPRRGLGYADDEPAPSRAWLDDDATDDQPDTRPARGWFDELDELDEPEPEPEPEATGEAAPTPTAAEAFTTPQRPEFPAYVWTTSAADVWADIWAEPAAPALSAVPDPVEPPAAPPRIDRRRRLGIVTVSAAVAIVAGIPAAVGLIEPRPGAAVAVPQQPVVAAPAPTVEPQSLTAPLVQPAVEATVPAAPIPVPKAPVVKPVTGIPNPCPIDLPFPASGDLAATVDRMERQWGISLVGSEWRQESYRPVVRIVSETLDAVDCTDYIKRVKAGNGGTFTISSGSTHSWAWGDYGLTTPGTLTLDFSKFKQGYADGDRGRLVRLVIHEMAHSLNADRGGEPAYWQRFHKVWAANGRPTAYGSTETEAFADAVGYYVARCAAQNPYADRSKKAYYDYVKAEIFGGREFGSELGTRQVCDGEGR